MNKITIKNKDSKESLSSLLVKKRVSDSEVSINKEKYKEAIDNIEELFSIMNSMYGHLWVLNYENNHSRDLWTAGLMDLSKSDIVNGINNCMKYQIKIPTLPEFRKMCLLNDNNQSLPLFK